MMEVEINPKLLDIVEVKDSATSTGGKSQGTIVANLGGPAETVLVEIADELGVPLAFVSRPVRELSKVWDASTSGAPSTGIPEAQQLFETGILYLQNGVIPRAKEYLGKAFSMDRNLARDLVNKTNSLADSGAIDTAIFVYEMILELLPDYGLPRENLAISFLNRGIAFARQGFFARAIEDFDRTLMLSPSDRITEAVRKNVAAAYGNFGILCAQAGRYDEGLRFLQRALELDPSETVRKNLGLTLIALSAVRMEGPESSTREEIFKQPLMMGLTLSECLNAYGATLAGLGKFPEAKRALEDAIEADPPNEIARKNLRILSARQAGQVLVVGLVPLEIQMPHRIRS